MKNLLVLLSLVVLFVSLSSVVFARLPLHPEADFDAERDAELAISSGSWFVFGFSYGGIGVISAVLSSPSADPGRLAGKSPAYVDAYVQVYKSVAKERRVKSSVVGCLTQSALTTLAIIAAR